MKTYDFSLIVKQARDGVERISPGKITPNLMSFCFNLCTDGQN